MKTTLKKLIFNDSFTRDDLIKRLMDGESFKYVKPNDMNYSHYPTTIRDLHYDKAHSVNPFRLDTNAWDWRGLKYLHEEIEQKWWEDPSAVGKAVKVRDSEFDKWDVAVFLSYNPDSAYRFNCSSNEYEYAETLTADDLYKGDV